MTVLTFDNIKVQDLNERLVDSIRAFFKHGTVRISVVVQDEAKQVFRSLDEVLTANQNAPFVVQFEPDFDFTALAEAVERDENLELSPVFEARKTAKPHAIAS